MDYPASAAQRFTLWHPRFALCAVCRRPAHGFGWQEPRGARQPRPSVWFCHQLSALLLDQSVEIVRHD
jgi:hypothetical protein